MILDDEDRNMSEAERQKKLMERKFQNQPSQQPGYEQAEFQQTQPYQPTSTQNNPYASGTYPAHPLVNSYQYEPTSEYYLSQLLSKKDLQNLLKTKTKNDINILNKQNQYHLDIENQATMNELEISKDFRMKNNEL